MNLGKLPKNGNAHVLCDDGLHHSTHGNRRKTQRIAPRKSAHAEVSVRGHDVDEQLSHTS
jgi:hypothetical protein